MRLEVRCPVSLATSLTVQQGGTEGTVLGETQQDLVTDQREPRDRKGSKTTSRFLGGLTWGRQGRGKLRVGKK